MITTTMLVTLLVLVALVVLGGIALVKPELLLPLHIDWTGPLTGDEELLPARWHSDPRDFQVADSLTLDNGDTINISQYGSGNAVIEELAAVAYTEGDVEPIDVADLEAMGFRFVPALGGMVHKDNVPAELMQRFFPEYAKGVDDANPVL